MELNPLKQLDPTVVAATIATFSVTYLVMRKVFFLPTIAVMERRNVRRLEAEEKYSEAQRILDASERAAARIGEETNEKVRESSERARAAAGELHEARLSETRAQTEALLEKGRASILAEAESERGRLRIEALECVSLSCEKLFGHVDRAVVESNVDRAIAKTLR
jgi:F0F1-type ATP synthase membrane subunit b/b'